jgi:hypothetical protein
MAVQVISRGLNAVKQHHSINVNNPIVRNLVLILLIYIWLGLVRGTAPSLR